MGEVTRYSDREQAWQRSELAVQNKQKLMDAFQVADVHLNRTYLDHFSIAPINENALRAKDISKLRVIEISKLVFDPSEKFTDKLISVYSALYSIGSAVALILNSDGNQIRFFVATRSDRDATVAGDILESGLRGNFPGIVYHAMDASDSTSFLRSIQESNVKSLASVSVVPSARGKAQENGAKIQEYVQGMEKFIDTMNGRSYTMVCLATPVDSNSLQIRKHGFEELCSALSPYAKLSASYGENESLSVNNSISSSFSKSVNRSVSYSNGTNSSSSEGKNSSSSSGSSWNSGFSSDGVSSGWGSNSGSSSGAFDSYTSGTSFSESFSNGSGTSNTDSSSKGKTDTKGSTKTLTVSYDNCGVANLIERAKAELNRFKKSESFGMWEFCAYFMSDDINSAAISSNFYRALVTGDESNVESAHLNIWSMNERNSIRKILDHVLYLQHPTADLPALNTGLGAQHVTPTNLVSGNELPLVMGFPKKSVSGLPVVESAEFGRAVVYENKIPKRPISFGNIYHMGVKEKPRVNMDLDLLSSHTFITGSSGSGKSFATYQLLQSAMDYDVKIMIVEPAKGEYKQIFGGLKGVKIFTTDPNAYRILRINPFQFPENIHILSHIEQLLQIFTASWPLYAAMPAILKQAVVDSYTRCGWDIQNSIWIPGISDHKYPIFADVLNILPDIINNSDYSSDSKGDYKGALLTRVQSMTVGMNGLIFRHSTGIDDSILFDSNVIIDLSELGSSEAIALIMGVLIMKLNEYRKSQRKSGEDAGMNSSLRHLTVLEEAHNLLKRTSKEQNQEGANMVGKSVEMISNSIKEMRTYGEGFVIIDQSPMAVDSAAIENTATKIIMNTPAMDACKELGGALSLKPEQTAELSRLDVGVAAVFQKGWLTPVLMKVDKWDNRYQTNLVLTDPGDLKAVKGDLLTELYAQKHIERFSLMRLRAITRASSLPVDKKRELDDIIQNFSDALVPGSMLDRTAFGNLLLELIGCQQLFSILPLDGIPTYAEFMELDADSDELDALITVYSNSSLRWMHQFIDALAYYVTLPEQDTLIEIITDLLYLYGTADKLRDPSADRLSMLCRMVYRELEIPMNER